MAKVLTEKSGDENLRSLVVGKLPPGRRLEQDRFLGFSTPQEEFCDFF